MIESCLHTKFDEQASRFPERTVARFEARELTYGELARQSELVAASLVALGIRPGDRVGVNLFRSLRLLPAILGTLEAGAVCVPIDPDDPVDRSVTILEQADAAAVLTEQELQGRFARAGHRILIIEELLGGPPGGAATPAVPRVAPDDLAFLFFTSGSTGTPKGVMLSHRALAAGQSWLAGTFPLAPGDAQLLRTTISITNIIREVFWPIFAGGTIVIVPPGGHKDPQQLLSLVIEHRVRTIMVVPALLSMMCDLPAFATARDLKYVFCSSDVMPASVAEKYFATGVPGKLFNLYGLTEALYCSYHQVSPGDRHTAFVPVGARAELTPMILDERLEPVLDGTVGELFISGVGMASGYYKLPELTASRFVDTPRGRLFRTGDLARMGSHGLELLGRSDNQVKIAGYRVELGELEAHLDRCPGVRKSVAVGRVDAHGHKRLIAYLTSDEPSGLRAEAIRAHLAAKLPDYLLPSAFAVVDEIPLTHNGKVDRARLEQMRGRILELYEEYVGPRTPTEAVFCKLWAEALGIERVGVHHNFFSLGGDSILGLLTATKAYRMGYRIPSTQVFSTPTVAELAAFLDANPHLRDPEAAAPRQEVAARDGQGFRPEAFAALGWSPADVARLAAAVTRRSAAGQVIDFYPLTELQKGMWFHSLLDPESGVYFEQFVYEIEGPLDLEQYRRAWRQVIVRHDILRCLLLTDGQTGPIQVIQETADADWEVHDWTDRQATFAADLERFLFEDRRRGFPYDRAPLLRLTFFKRAPDRHQMVISYHHLILDAWSLFVILNESLRIYYAAQRREPLALSPARSFRSYVASMLAEDVEASHRYWLRVLDGFDRPTKIGRAEKLGLSASELEKHLEARLDLTEPETAALLEFGRRNQLTLNTLVQAGWALLLGAYSESTDVCFGITITHRPVTVEGVEDMVGIFINSLPIRLRVAPGDLMEWLHEVQRAQVSARAHDYYSLPRLQQHTSVPGDEPLFETLLIFENFPRGVGWQKDNDVQVRQRRYVGWTNYPFAIEAMPEEHLFFQVKYDEAFFSTAAVEQILRDYRAILVAIATGAAETTTAAQATATGRGAAAAAPSDIQPRGTVRQPERRIRPGTPAERELAEIWSRVLGISDLDIHTPFLQLGGDSLKGIQVLTLAREAGFELELRDLFARSGTLAALAAAAQLAPAERRLQRLWASVCGVEVESADADFFAAGGTAALAARLVQELNRTTGAGLPLSAFLEHRTLRAQAELLGPLGAVPAGGHLIALRRGEPQPLVVLVHPVGGTLYGYKHLFRALSPDWTIYGLESPPTRPVPATLTELGARYADELSRLDRPFHLIGWSMGGIISLEIARRLAGTRARPRSITVIDGHARAPGAAPVLSRAQAMAVFVSDYLAGAGSREPAPLPGEGDTFARYLEAQKDAGRLPHDLPGEELEQVFLRFEALYRLFLGHELAPGAHAVREGVLAIRAARSREGRFHALAPIERLIELPAAQRSELDFDHQSIMSPDAMALLVPLIELHVRRHA